MGKARNDNIVPKVVQAQAQRNRVSGLNRQGKGAPSGSLGARKTARILNKIKLKSLNYSSVYGTYTFSQARVQNKLTFGVIGYDCSSCLV